MNLLDNYSLCVSEINAIKKQLIDLILHDENNKNLNPKLVEGFKFLKVIQFSDLTDTWDFKKEKEKDIAYKKDIEESIISSKDVIRTLSNMINNRNVSNKNGKSYSYFTKLKPDTINVIKNILGGKQQKKRIGKGRNISSR